MKIVGGMLNILDTEGNTIYSFDNVEPKVQKMEDGKIYVILDSRCDEDALNSFVGFCSVNKIGSVETFLCGRFRKITITNNAYFTIYSMTNYENGSVVGISIRFYYDEGKFGKL